MQTRPESVSSVNIGLVSGIYEIVFVFSTV
jgi:hypothetical protein